MLFSSPLRNSKSNHCLSEAMVSIYVRCIYHFASLYFLLTWHQHLSLIRLVATVSLQWIQSQQTQQLLNDLIYIRNLNMTGLPFLRQRLKLSVILALPLKISSMSRSWSRPDKMLTKSLQCLDTNWANILEILVLGHGLGSTWSRKHPHPFPQSDTRNPPSVSSEHIRVVGLYRTLLHSNWNWISNRNQNWWSAKRENGHCSTCR